MVSDTSSELLRSFDEYDDANIIVHEECLQVANYGTNFVNEVLLDRAKFNQSYSAVQAQCKRINAVPGTEIEIPTDKRRLKR